MRIFHRKQHADTHFGKISNDSILKAISYFCILFYPFNNTISDKILFGKYNPYIFAALAITSFIFTKKQKSPKKYLFAILPILLATSLIIINNQYILNNERVGAFLISLIYIVAVIYIFRKDVDPNIFLKVAKIYFLEHIIGSLIPIIFPEFYSNTILPFICTGLTSECTAAYNFQTGSNAGLTTHYSTNGIYASIFSILFFSEYSVTKKKSSFILSIVSILLLFIIGKRAHLIFTVIAILLTYIIGVFNARTSSGRKKHKIILLLSFIATFSLLLFTASQYLPNLSSTINRLSSGQNDLTEMLNGREALYELAISGWKESPIFGNGWGSYIFRSNNTFGAITYGYEYMHAHNDYLEILCDTGIIGLSLYIVLLLHLLRKAYYVLRQQTHPTSLAIFSATYLTFHILYSLTGSPIGTISALTFFTITACILFSQKRSIK